MRYMTLVKCPEPVPPMPPSFLEAMGRAAGEARQAGTLLDTGGLAPTHHSARVRLADGKVTVMDGPYAEGKEVVGGFAVVEAASLDEALEGAVWLMNFHREHWPGWEGEVEVRPILAPGDVPAARS